MKIKASNKTSIRQRSNGSYEARYTINGKQYSVYAKTLNELKYKLNINKKEKINELKTLPSKNPTLREYYNKWLRLYKLPFLADSSILRIKRIYSRYILPVLGHLTIDSITTDQIQEIIVSLNDKHRQQTMALQYLNNCFKQAYNSRMIKFNPVNGVVFKKQESVKGKALSIEEEKQFLSYLNAKNHTLTNLYKLYLYTGVRRTEALNLTQSDIDRVNNIIYINGTKTQKSARKIKTVEKVINLIPTDTDIPFSYNEDYVSRQFSKIMKILGLNGYTLHSLRHTFATRCYTAGIDLKMIQYWLGHSTIKLTADTYTHVEEISQAEALEKLHF